MKTGLPHSHLALVEDSKLDSYLLSDAHPAGRSKSAFFKGFGFNALTSKILRDALLAHAGSAAVLSISETEFGTKYMIEGELSCPDGRKPILRSIWFFASGQDVPRLVTAYPAKEKSSDQGV